MTLWPETGRRLAEARGRRGLSQQAVAEAAGLSQQKVSAHERGIVTSAEAVRAHAAAVGLDLVIAEVRGE